MMQKKLFHYFCNMESQKHKKTSQTVKLGTSSNSVPLTASELESLKQSTAEAKAYLRKAFQKQIKNSPSSVKD